MSRVRPIVDDVHKRGDKALIELTAKFDGIKLDSPVISAPFPSEAMMLDDDTRNAIDQAYENIYKFHEAQYDRSTLVVETMPAQYDRSTLVVETMPGVVCSRFSRPIERVGLYVPGGTATLPSTTLMLGIPAKVAGCKQITIASPPCKDGSVIPEVLYVAHKVGASKVLLAGGAQAIAALAYGTESVPKVDKICGPGNQYVTAAKMLAQNDSFSNITVGVLGQFGCKKIKHIVFL
ncbi:10434_t:CDS:2 [Entrophospora sp. SA101]|nr:10434_t:CDS:2 [Entrophospora sp. SA101]